jgi:hypothetical protein
MKKLLLIFIFFASSFNIWGQIQLVHTSPVKREGDVGVLHLYYAGNKFVEKNDSLNLLTLYNSDFSVYKTINLPVIPDAHFYNRWIHYLTENLFDTDTTDLEYLLYYQDTNLLPHVRIYDESGSLLFQRDSASSYPNFGNMRTGVHPYSSEIDYIDSTFYLRLFTPTGTEIYQLPGVIPCFDPCSNSNAGLSTGLKDNVNMPFFYLSDPVPNPATNETEINYNLPPKVQSGLIIIYDQQGSRFKEIPVYPSVNKISISMDDFRTGVYYYSISWDGSPPTTTRKLMVVK